MYGKYLINNPLFYGGVKQCQQNSEEAKKTETVAEAEARCICTDCILKIYKEKEDS